MLIYKISSNAQNLTCNTTIDEGLYFGWIDGLKRTIDSEKYIQYFGKQNPKSVWSKINKDKIKKLIKLGLGRDSGL